MGGVDEPVADRVGKRGLTDHVMPGVDGKLTGDEVDARSVRSSRTSSRSWRSGVVSGARPQSPTGRAGACRSRRRAGSAIALIDRLIHHAEIITIEGESYRRRAAEVTRKAPRSKPTS